MFITLKPLPILTPGVEAHTLIAIRHKQVSAKYIRIGDEVLTHQGNFKKVLRITSSLEIPCRLKVLGNLGIMATAETRFLAKERVYGTNDFITCR